jgi:hypothetical protein
MADHVDVGWLEGCLDELVQPVPVSVPPRKFGAGAGKMAFVYPLRVRPMYSAISIFFDADGQRVGDADGCDTCSGRSQMGDAPCGGCGACLISQAIYSGLRGVLASRSDAEFHRDHRRMARHDRGYLDIQYRQCTVCALESAGKRNVQATYVAQDSHESRPSMWFECEDHGPKAHADACGDTLSPESVRSLRIPWAEFQELLLGQMVADTLAELLEGESPVSVWLKQSTF